MQQFGPKGIAVREKLAELAEPSVKHLPPFDGLEYTSLLDNFLPYIREYPGSEQEHLIKALISLKKFQIGGEPFRDREAYELLNPIRKKIAETFVKNWEVQTSKVKPFSGDFTLKDAKACLIKVMKERLPAFKNEKVSAFADPAIVFFTAPLLPSTKLLIGFDRGTMMPGRFTPYLAISEPPFMVDVGNLLSEDRGTWYYSSPKDCEKAVNQMIDLVEKLIPIFTAKVREALEK
jgi:hypothetical protein